MNGFYPDEIESDLWVHGNYDCEIAEIDGEYYVYIDGVFQCICNSLERATLQALPMRTL